MIAPWIGHLTEGPTAPATSPGKFSGNRVNFADQCGVYHQLGSQTNIWETLPEAMRDTTRAQAGSGRQANELAMDLQGVVELTDRVQGILTCI